MTMAEAQLRAPLARRRRRRQRFRALLQKEFKPKTDEAKMPSNSRVQTLAQQALAQTS
jgi:hypothetical protein